MIQIQVFIINYNGHDTILATIRSILSSEGISPEITVIDDCSDDDSIDLLKKNYPDIEIIRQPINTKNLNKLRNIGLNRACKEYLMITDNDIVFKEDCIYELFKLMKMNHNNAIVTPRLMYLSEPERVYAAGTKVHYIGAAICPNRDLILRTFNDKVEQNSGGGILLCNRDILLKSGGFDDKLLMAWGDDGEFYQRVLRFGYNCLYSPTAVAYHEFKPFNKKRHYRVLGQVYNRMVFIITHYSLATLILLSPILLFYEIMQIGFLSLKGYFFILLKGYFYFIKNVRYIYKKRVMIQSMRKVADKEIFFADTIYIFNSHLRNSIYIKLFNVINVFLNWYWRKIYNFLPLIFLPVEIRLSFIEFSDCGLTILI